ncbi:putative permease [uncultured Alphaproteobacteria bacterium]|uniref:Putative permease n=1 Tax=uncultured Alphaproteobacteria bacterium TaxID=91750 RepID=A0A212JI09_9PROT|nr:putative permease [uncultured Alphaproteobacteria bacterium]
MFHILLNIIAPVFLIGLVGFVWARRGHAFDTNQIGALVTNVGAPCMVLDTLSSMTIGPSAFGAMVLASALCHAAFFAGGWALLKIGRQPVSAYLPGLVFGNTGNLGLPLCLFAFGEPGLSAAMSYFVLSTILLFTLSPQFATGRASLAVLPKTPVVWALAAALALMFTGTPMPEWLGRPVHLLGAMMIPLMLLSLGVSLARLKINALGIGAALAVARLGMGTAVGFAVAALLGLEGVERGVVVLESAMPAAVFNYLFAVRYRKHPDELASMVILSTALAFLTLPVLLSVLLP